MGQGFPPLPAPSPNLDVKNMITIDMYLAATFLAYGADLIKVDRENPNRQRFEFGGSIEQIFVLGTDKVVLRVENPEFDVIKNKYLEQTLLFPPTYADSVRRIKAVIHDN
jgi:hypothetical protein